MKDSNHWSNGNRPWAMRKRITRRGLIKTGTLAAAAAASAAYLSCGGDEEEQGAAKTPVAQSTPKAGGKAVFAFGSDVPSFDPTISPAAQYVGGRLYNPLHTLNFKTQEIVPLIAESVEQPDDTTYVWKLRAGVKFQNVDPVNGREVVAEDARYTFDRLATSQSSNDQALVKTHAASLEATDKYTFTLKTKKPYAPTLAESGFMQYCLVPREAVEKFGDLAANAVGCGPFYLVEHTRDERWRFRKNPDYFRAGLPYVDEEEWLIIQDASTQWQMLKTGRVDACTVAVDRLKREEMEGTNLELVDDRDVSGPLFWMRVDRPPLNDERVREALDIAIDRDDFVAKAYFGEGKWNGPVPWTLDYWALPQEELKEILKCDPEKAKQLLSAAGHGDGFELKPPIRSDGPAAADAMTVFAEHLSKVGIKVTIQMQDLGKWLAAVYGGDYDITFSGTYPSLQPETFLRYYHSKGQTGSDNSTKVNDPDIDAWIEGMWGILDVEERRDYCIEIQRKILAKHGPMICTAAGELRYARSRKLRRSDAVPAAYAGPLYWMGTEYWLDEQT